MRYDRKMFMTKPMAGDRNNIQLKELIRTVELRKFRNIKTIVGFTNWLS